MTLGQSPKLCEPRIPTAKWREYGIFYRGVVWGFRKVIIQFLAQCLAHDKCSLVAIVKGMIVNHRSIANNHKISVA